MLLQRYVRAMGRHMARGNGPHYEHPGVWGVKQCTAQHLSEHPGRRLLTDAKKMRQPKRYTLTGTSCLMRYDSIQRIWNIQCQHRIEMWRSFNPNFSNYRQKPKAKAGDLANLISYNQLMGEGMLGSIMKIWKQPKCPPAG